MLYVVGHKHLHSKAQAPADCIQPVLVTVDSVEGLLGTVSNKQQNGVLIGKTHALQQLGHVTGQEGADAVIGREQHTETGTA